jgi:acyl-coenzyme A thioesterase PaaI-like protein
VKPPVVLTADELTRHLTAEFPQMLNAESGLSIEDVWHGGSRLRQAFRAHSIRPGETVGGATLMALGDYAIYVAILAAIGWHPLTVTTSLNVNFLRKPAKRDLIAECRLLKLGQRLAVGEATMRSDGEDEPVAHLTATYSIPPNKP